jgi:hypothetical protein
MSPTELLHTPLRLRGLGPALIWPDALTAACADPALALVGHVVETPGGCWSPSALRVARRQQNAEERARQRCRALFAEANGFNNLRFYRDPTRTSPRAVYHDFSLQQLRAGGGSRNSYLLHHPHEDHPEHFRLARRPAAIVVHLYGALTEQDLDSLVVVGLTIDRLPFSWYFPGTTVAYCYRRAA